jgi:chemotaxis regulatin CheY-phosphate phosphatase CheZ
MRIFVTGKHPSTKVLERLLEANGYTISEYQPFMTLILEYTNEPYIIVDGVDSEFERRVINNIAEITPSKILLNRIDGIESDQEMRIFVNYDPTLCDAVERGVLRALMQVTRHTAERTLQNLDKLPSTSDGLADLKEYSKQMLESLIAHRSQLADLQLWKTSHTPKFEDLSKEVLRASGRLDEQLSTILSLNTKLDNNSAAFTTGLSSLQSTITSLAQSFESELRYNRGIILEETTSMIEASKWKWGDLLFWRKN